MPAAEAPWHREFAGCRDEYARFDERVAGAGVASAAYYRVPGYPYLRTDRFLASFRHEVSGVNQVGDWLRRMREMDQEAREYEYIDLGLSQQQAAIQRFRFLNCGRALEAQDLEGPEGFARLVAAVEPPDEYSTADRLLALYPLAVPFMKARLHADHRAWAARRPSTRSGPEPGAGQRLWAVRPTADPGLVDTAFAHMVVDELGTPGLVESEWRALAEYHAPRICFQGDDASGLAAPALAPGGAVADRQQHLVHYWVSYARLAGQIVIQINYFIWFGAAGADGAQLDGLIWRVTLDQHGEVLVYDSVGENGRGHHWFPVSARLRVKPGRIWSDPPSVAEGLSPPNAATLQLGAGSHEPVEVAAAASSTAPAAEQYELRPYEDLFTLPGPSGRSRSLFDGSGRVVGTEARPPVRWLASGVPHSGALRQYGHHPISDIGRLQFDDPFLLETVFTMAPAGASVETAAAR